MKKKLFFGVATVFFAVATMFNMNMLQSSSAGDVSLEAIAVMAQAQSEGPDAQNCRWNRYSRCTINTTTNSYCPLYACRSDF